MRMMVGAVMTYVSASSVPSRRGEADLRVPVEDVGEGAAKEDQILVLLVLVGKLIEAEGLDKDLEANVVLRAGNLAGALK
jgi:hypothetical protein